MTPPTRSTVLRTRSLVLPLLALAGACASAPSARPHPPVAPPATVEPEEVPVPVVEGETFAVFRGDGTPAGLDDLVREAGRAEVVLWGEQHGDQVGHGVQSLLLQRLYAAYGPPGPSPHGPGAGGPDAGDGPGVHEASNAGTSPAPTRSAAPAPPAARSLVLSLEMFERDVQYVVDEYLDGFITEDHFLASSRPWGGYEERYRPAVEFARAHDIPVVAANAPRRYVNRASRLGRESLAELPDRALSYLPPLPYPGASPAYRAEWDEIMGPAARHMAGSPLDAQTLWDATMAWSIARALEASSDPLVLHFAGSFHVQNGTGTPEALDHYRPGTRQLLVVAEPAGTLDALPDDARELGHFVILTREPLSPHGGS